MKDPKSRECLEKYHRDRERSLMRPESVWGQGRGRKKGKRTGKGGGGGEKRREEGGGQAGAHWGESCKQRDGEGGLGPGCLATTLTLQRACCSVSPSLLYVRTLKVCEMEVKQARH